MIDLDLTGRVAIVTGASAGIGRACTRALTERGASVVAVARRESLLKELAAELTAGGLSAPHIVPADVGAEESAAAIVANALERFGRIDILVSSAGGSRTLPVGAPEHFWREALEVNFFGTRRLGEAVIDAMARNKWGRILNITGTSEPRQSKNYGGLEGRSYLNAANSAKAAVHAWAKGLSREVGKHGITVNSIAPGIVRSEQVGRIYGTGPVVDPAVLDQIPLGRLGEAEELAAVVAFLVSEAGRYITGEVYHVDGGLRKFAF